MINLSIATFRSIFPKFIIFSVIAVAVSFFININESQAQHVPTNGFSGIMTIDDLPPDYFANQIFPAAVMTTYAYNSLTGDCALSFLGVTCFGKLTGSLCEFKSEDCGGPKGWNCSVYSLPSSNGFGTVHGVQCKFPGDRRLSFSYSGATSPDLTGLSLEAR